MSQELGTTLPDTLQVRSPGQPLDRPTPVSPSPCKLIAGIPAGEGLGW
jgi:hypothetical protein